MTNVFTITTEWKRDETGTAWMRSTTTFLGQKSVTGEWESLPDATRSMTVETIAALVLEGTMYGVSMIEHTLSTVQYVPPEEFEKLVRE